jgi:hypothetical protein
MKTRKRLSWKNIAAFCILNLCLNLSLIAVIDTSYISHSEIKGSFKLSSSAKPAALFVCSEDYDGVQRAVKDLQVDLGKVTGTQPEILTTMPLGATEIVLIGTLGKNSIIDRLVKNGVIDVAVIQGKWETFLIQVVDNPIKGIEKALIIVGSDKRGAIFGIYDLCQQIGVSPWYWWADVPIEHSSDLYVLPGRHTQGEPAVKYRGIFINDEAPALSGWAQEKFGGFNHIFYENVFELILRLKGNYLWPAMWGSAFYDDDSLNAKLADEYGVVIGTSHHEPLMRAHDEWRRYGSGPWNYDKNPEKLREFWTEGIKRMGSNESIVTIGMRGDGDEPMTEGTAIALLEKIVNDQRRIIGDITSKDPTEIPQDWALYKEVQDYYDKGMRVPDDITLLLCDDNWGNVRRLPKPGDTERVGGYGMYYHFDFVGGPRNYKWLNTNPIARIWEQMHLCYEHGVDQIWIVNVGDIKPMEYPIQFFLDYAWNPEQYKAEALPRYAELWAKEQFGKTYASRIADFMTRYLMYNSRKKPEMLSSETYSLVNYREAERVVNEYLKLAEEAKQTESLLPETYRDAYYQLVLHPIEASANLYQLYYLVAKNRQYAKQGRVATNELAVHAKLLFENDAEITRYYNENLANGKWNHMMDQTHIGYTSWQQPDKNSMPEVMEISLPNKACMGVMVEGADSFWLGDKSKVFFPTFDKFNKQEYFLEIFNRGKSAFDYKITSDKPWVISSGTSGKIDKEARINVSINWRTIPAGDQQANLTICGPDKDKVVVKIYAKNPSEMNPEIPSGFIENNGYISIEAEHFLKAYNDNTSRWQIIPSLGRTLSGVTSIPTTLAEYEPGGETPRLEYPLYLFKDGKVKLNVYISPTLNYYRDEGLKYGISIDDEPIQIVSIHVNDTISDWKYPAWWNQSVSDNIRILTTEHNIENPGLHMLKIWLVTPGVVVQKIVIDAGGLKPSYLGPPESLFISGN